MILPLLLPNGWADQGERDSHCGSSEEKSIQGLKASCSAHSLSQYSVCSLGEYAGCGMEGNYIKNLKLRNVKHSAFNCIRTTNRNVILLESLNEIILRMWSSEL